MSNHHEPSHELNAIALQYNQGEIPFVCAAGTEEAAKAILESAQSLNIPIFEHEELLTNLAKLQIGQNIPKELYLIIAQILAFVYHVKGIYPDPSAQSNHTQG